LILGPIFGGQKVTSLPSLNAFKTINIRTPARMIPAGMITYEGSVPTQFMEEPPVRSL